MCIYRVRQVLHCYGWCACRCSLHICTVHINIYIYVIRSTLQLVEIRLLNTHKLCFYLFIVWGRARFVVLKIKESWVLNQGLYVLYPTTSCLVCTLIQSLPLVYNAQSISMLVVCFFIQHVAYKMICYTLYICYTKMWLFAMPVSGERQCHRDCLAID